MSVLVPGGLAIVLYLITGAILAYSVSRQQKLTTLSPILSLLAIAAVTIHGSTVYLTLFTERGVDLGFFRVSSLIFWFITSISLISSWRQPVANLLIPMFPLAALSIAVSLLMKGSYTPRHFDNGILLHILLSILAYSVITIAAIQAVALAIQERLLKRKQMKGLINALPPLQTMEALLFQMIWIGFILLGSAIISGIIFVEDLFAQHLAHKTALSIIAFGVFAVLLWGRHQQGWRSTTAIRWTIAGFLILMLAFFGSKFVLELLLNGS